MTRFARLEIHSGVFRSEGASCLQLIRKWLRRKQNLVIGEGFAGRVKRLREAHGEI